MGVSEKMAELLCSLCSCLSDEERQQNTTSRTIDKQLAREKVHYKKTMKILLLGSGESGKSTFIKQMRIIHGKDYFEDELREYKPIIYGNIVKGMKVLIDARDKLYIPWGDKDNVKNSNIVFSYDNNVKLEETVFLMYVPSMEQLWKDSGIITAFDRRREYQLVCVIVKLNIYYI